MSREQKAGIRDQKEARRWKACLLIPALFLLSACGFHSVYGAHETSDDIAVADDLNDIAIDNIPDRNGQILRNDLVDRMYRADRPSQPLYHLSVHVRSSEEDLGVLANATATRSLVNMYGDYTLTDAQGNQILSGTAHSVANIARLDQMYGTVASLQDAYARTLNEVSEQITNRLSLYFAERK